MPELTRDDFQYYFVAYIDILGFSKMVESDIQTDHPNLFLTKLFNVYETTRNSFGNHQNLQVIQFSDSVVFAIPNTEENFSRFINIIGQFQYNLFSQGLLCRGGISFGKHYYNNGFLFSGGLIEAYLIERTLSRYPRIAISSSLLDWLYPRHVLPEDCHILKENDGTYFVDFIPNETHTQSADYLEKILKGNTSADISIKEKHQWLSEYFDHKTQILGLKIKKFSEPRFSI